MKTFDEQCHPDEMTTVKKTATAEATQIDEPFVVESREGPVEGEPGDYLMKGADGEVYVCKQEIFEETYTDEVYDSTDDTVAHIRKVRSGMMQAALNLIARARDHDKSKLESPEKEIFDEYTPKLEETTYGSDEYKQYLEQMQEGLDHHYAQNSHHPEHFLGGIQCMTLIDLLEMLIDWRAATERHDDGDIARSIVQNAERFGYGDELTQILYNTAEDLEQWLGDEFTDMEIPLERVLRPVATEDLRRQADKLASIMGRDAPDDDCTRDELIDFLDNPKGTL